MTHFRMISPGILAFLLVACGSQEVAEPPQRTDSSMASAGSAASSTSTEGLGAGGLGGGEMIPVSPETGELGMVLYFDFDQSDLRPEYADLLARHARRLANDADARMRLEGHADERGSREYNIGLGERRSQAVRRMLLIQGASTRQISTVSFGEERPAALGNDEESWALNRRVEIKYTN